MSLRPHTLSPSSIRLFSRTLCRQTPRTCQVAAAAPSNTLARTRSRPLHSAPHRPQQRQDRRPLAGSVSITALAAGIAVALTGFFAWSTYYAATDGDQDTTDDEMPIASPHSTEILPGRPGNLTLEQQAKLRELWYELGKLIGMDAVRPSFEATYKDDDAASMAPSSIGGKKKRRFGIGRKKEDGGADQNDKHGSNKEFKTALADMTHEELRNALWDFSKCDDIDSNLCRYLRARKWNVHNALVMLVSTIYWRRKTMKLDTDVMVNGEEAAVRALRGESTGTGGLSPQLAHDMLAQFRMGKSYIHGVDKVGRPLCFVRVKLHRIGEYSSESLERLTVYMIETARFMLKPPQLETAVMVFDMTGFSMANMDYTPLKFIIKVFEANYPESLGVVLVHKAPWIFSGIWNVIKGWLDPVVASKINFTKDVEDLAKFIDMDNIPFELGGDEDWEYTYPEPYDGENRLMEDTKRRQELETERKGLIDQFEAATFDWVLANGINDAEPAARRAKVAAELSRNYWQLDPYVRSRTLYDRMGIIGEKGQYVPYPTHPPFDGTTAKTNGVNGINGIAARDADAASIRSVETVYYDARDTFD